MEITDRLGPSAVTVPAGSTVRWHNADGERHRVRSESGPEEFDSGNLEPAGTWSETFSVPGEYRYVDARNPDRRAYWGSITVTGGTGSSDDSAPATGEPGSTTPDDGRGGQGPISMGDRSFAPASIDVPVGTTLTWVNDSDRDHTVTAGGGSFDSGEMPPGARFSRTFDQPGSYEYFCAFHSGMLGTVVVGDAAAEQDASGEEVETEAGPADATEQTTDRGSAPGGTDPAGSDVEVRDFAFAPESLEVAVGSTVTWRNVGDAPHTVTADDQSFDSGMMGSGDTFSHTFDRPGSYRYVCELHPQMVAVVTVGDVGGAQAPDAGASQASGEGQRVAASPAPSRQQGLMPIAALLVAALLVSASVLVGAGRVGRSLRREADTG